MGTSLMARPMLVALLVLGCGESDEIRREQVYQGYIEAVNAHDVSAALSYHTPDAEFLIPGQRLMAGTESMRALLQWDSVMGSQLRFVGVQWSGDTLSVGPGVERSAWFAAIGLDSIRYAPGTRFVFEGDRIRGIYPSALTVESAQEFNEKIGVFMAWAQENAPEVSQLAPGGQFTYDRRSAQGWLEVLERYRTADRRLEPVTDLGL